MEVDNSGNFNKDTGTFVAPADGTYVFFFNAVISTATHGEVQVTVNGNTIQYFLEYDDTGGYGNERQMSEFWSVSLKYNEELRLFNPYDSSIYIEGQHQMYFMGFRTN